MRETSTRSDDIYRRIRADILAGRLEPGAQLGFARLKADYAASMGVLREALMRLTADGLAVNQAQHGFRVMSLSLNDLADLTESRCLIEGMVLRDSIANGDIEWEGRIVSAHHRMERTPKHIADDPRLVSVEWEKAHHEFHMALNSAAKSRRLQSIAATLRASAEVYRRWSIPHESPKRDVSAEHLELLNLCLARDAAAAAAALTQHLTLTQRVLMHGLNEHTT